MHAGTNKYQCDKYIHTQMLQLRCSHAQIISKFKALRDSIFAL